MRLLNGKCDFYKELQLISTKPTRSIEYFPYGSLLLEFVTLLILDI